MSQATVNQAAYPPARSTAKPTGRRNIDNNAAPARSTTAGKIPLNRSAVAAAVAAIPLERNPELVREMARAVKDGDGTRVRALLVRWVMIGSHYADPDREINHPLAGILGAFANEPLMDRLAEAIARERAGERD